MVRHHHKAHTKTTFNRRIARRACCGPFQPGMDIEQKMEGKLQWVLKHVWEGVVAQIDAA